LLARSPAIESVVVNVLLSVSPEMGIIALSNKGRAYFRTQGLRLSFL